MREERGYRTRPARVKVKGWARMSGPGKHSLGTTLETALVTAVGTTLGITVGYVCCKP